MGQLITPRWSGFLTYDNMEEVAAAILTLLDGKTFAIAEVNNLCNGMPALSTGMELVDDKAFVVRGSIEGFGCYLGLKCNGSSSIDYSWYVRVLDGLEVCRENSTYISLGFGQIEFTTLSDTRGLECIKFVIQK